MFGSGDSGDADEIKKLARSVVGMVEGGILLMKNKQDIQALKDMTAWIRYLVAAYVSARAAR